MSRIDPMGMNSNSEKKKKNNNSAQYNAIHKCSNIIPTKPEFPPTNLLPERNIWIYLREIPLLMS